MGHRGASRCGDEFCRWGIEGHRGAATRSNGFLQPRQAPLFRRKSTVDLRNFTCVAIWQVFFLPPKRTPFSDQTLFHPNETTWNSSYQCVYIFGTGLQHCVYEGPVHLNLRDFNEFIWFTSGRVDLDTDKLDFQYFLYLLKCILSWKYSIPL